LDVLVVINYLNRTHERNAAPEGESSLSKFMSVEAVDSKDFIHDDMDNTLWVRENFVANSHDRFDGRVSRNMYRDLKQPTYTDTLDTLKVPAVFNRKKLFHGSEVFEIDWTYASQHDAVFAELGLDLA